MAPLNEALAAGMLMLSDWDKKTDLYDPMCGSGTILVEAAMMAQNLAPRLFSNRRFAIEKWENFNLMLWKKVQHYVVVGGAFVQAGQQQAASTGGGASQGHLPQGVQPTVNPTTLHH